MARAMKTDPNTVDRQGFTEANRLCGFGEVRAVA